MKFFPKKRRQAPAIIIISLIDVLLVLLVFLLMTTTYKNQPAVRLTLPESASAPRPGASEMAPPLVVTIAKAAPHFYLGPRPLTLDQLREELVAARKQDPKVRMVLRADEEANWGWVVQVMEMAQKANIADMKAWTRGRGVTAPK